MPDPTAGELLGERLVDRYRHRDPNAISIGNAGDLVTGGRDGWLDAINNRDELIAIGRALDAGVVLVVINPDHPLRDDLVELAQSDEACFDTLEGRPWGVVLSESAAPPPVVLILDPLARGPMPTAGDRCVRCGAVYAGFTAGRHRWESRPLAETGVLPCSPADHRTA